MIYDKSNSVYIEKLNKWSDCTNLMYNVYRGYLKMIMVIFKHFPQFLNTWDVSYLGRVIQITQISSFAHVTMVAIIKTVRMFHTHRHLHHLMCMNRKLKMVSYT